MTSFVSKKERRLEMLEPIYACKTQRTCILTEEAAYKTEYKRWEWLKDNPDTQPIAWPKWAETVDKYNLKNAKNKPACLFHHAGVSRRTGGECPLTGPDLKCGALFHPCTMRYYAVNSADRAAATKATKNMLRLIEQAKHAHTNEGSD